MFSSVSLYWTQACGPSEVMPLLSSGLHCQGSPVAGGSEIGQEKYRERLETQRKEEPRHPFPPPPPPPWSFSTFGSFSGRASSPPPGAPSHATQAHSGFIFHRLTLASRLPNTSFSFCHSSLGAIANTQVGSLPPVWLLSSSIHLRDQLPHETPSV